MHVAGVELPAAVVAELARLLRDAGCVQPAMHLGFVVDSGRPDLRISPLQQHEIVGVLRSDYPAELVDLHLVLDDTLHRRAS